MGSSRSGIRGHDEEQTLSMADITYRNLMFITEKCSVSDFTAMYRLIDNLEDNLAPYIDKPYKEDMEAIRQLRKPKANNSATRAFIATEHTKKVYRMKHQALVKLAFRLGWLGNLQTHRVTEISNDIGGHYE